MTNNHCDFELSLGGDIYPSDEITEAILIDSINQLAVHDLDFLVLTPKEPIKKSLFIQAISDFIVEIRLVTPNNGFTHYSYMTDNKEEVTTLFLNYFTRKEIPLLDHWKIIDTDKKKKSLFAKIFKR